MAGVTLTEEQWQQLQQMSSEVLRLGELTTGLDAARVVAEQKQAAAENKMLQMEAAQKKWET